MRHGKSISMLLLLLVAATTAIVSRGVAAQARHVTHPALGHPDAPWTVTIFADLECPHARRALGVVRELVERRPGQVRVVFENTAVPYHPSSERAAVAALVAAEHGRFWPYVDALLADQGRLDDASLVQRATALGLDGGAFARELDRGDLRERVRHERRLASLLGVRSSVAVFVDGRRVLVPKDADELDRAIVP